MSRQRTGLYLRISSDTQGDAAGVARQEQDALALAKARGLRVVATYTDNDRSAWSGKVRPEWDRMLADLKAGHLDVILAWANDRLYRRTRDQLILVETLAKVGGSLVTVKDGDVDPNTAEGRMRLSILASIAEFESGRKSERVTAKLRANAEAGKPHGGRRPFGWLPGGMELDPQEAPVVREVARRVLAGESLRSIAQGLNTRGIPTVMGRTWGIATIRTMMLNPRLAGLRAYRGTVIGRGTWEPILDSETWDRVRALLSDPARRTTRPGARQYLLTGLVSCGRCGQLLVAQPRADGRRRYVCSRDPGRRGGLACGTVTVMAEPVEELVVDALLEEAQEVNLPERIAATIEEPASSEGIEARKVQLAQAWADGTLDYAEWQAAKGSLDRQLEEVQASEDVALRQRTAAANVQDLAQEWAGMADDRRRVALAAVISRVNILPAADQAGPRRFDPARVEVAWAA